MKSISKIYGIVLSIVLVGCELDEEPIGLITRDQISTEPTESSVTSSVNSSYQLLSNTLNIIGNWDWTGGKVLRNDFILQDIASGDMNKKWNPDGDQAWMDEVAAFNFTAINGAFNGIWSYDYEGISRANTAISILSNPDITTTTALDTETKDRLLGEAYFLRAFYYFDLLNHFGGVPLLTEPLEDFSAAYEVSNRATEQEVFALIESDLETAVGLLPTQKYSSNAEPWRVSIGAAKAMQAKVDLFQENWEMSLIHIEELQSWNFYSLNTHYFDSFNVEKEFMEDEVIFAYDHRQELNPGRGNGLAALMGWGFIAPTEDFENAFESEDPRLDYTIETETQTAHKLLGSTDGQYKGNADSPGNKIYIRYADVLLWKAEALIETGQVEAGIEIIDQIRMRAQNTPSLDGSTSDLEMYSGTGLSQEQALEVLYKERRLELGFESHRFNDLKRWGIADEVLTEMGKNFQNHNYLYPIPQGEIDRSGGQIEQNPGY
ncbi:RagB/SusD family nutrient uptake outer membrane protein [Salegentibacter sp. JZCK2]|uniref:RagB/SusD family nutrient uptake outer membrane protein n=1 Tax=Salegentibacter tibetensis TaxID=2873600 RepID=UPI001CCC3238|nr:RagB/SusD family nutrient uptake outer membrane protein [Salegentibacter tibetensis]MBZ9728674.1 RagB/SusD family nutrient uptake outer membrane protein [Salegentibacter tibetensis]